MTSFCPIGVFDSGVGGLTVLKDLLGAFPSESFVYLGDTAHVPYGSRSPESLLGLMRTHLQFFSEQKVKALVLACNTASTLIPSLTSEIRDFGSPVLGVITPGCVEALQVSRNKKIGVIATRATILSQAYPNEILRLAPESQVTAFAAPLLVPLVEEGWVDDPITNLVVQRHCHVFKESSVDTLILGCTHFPILRPAFARVLGAHVNLIESGPAVCQDLRGYFTGGWLEANPGPAQARVKVYTTDESPSFRANLERILGPHVLNRVDSLTLRAQPVAV